MRVPPSGRLTGWGQLEPGKSNHQRKPSGDVTLRISLHLKVDDKTPGDRRDKSIPGDNHKKPHALLDLILAAVKIHLPVGKRIITLGG